ncbi:Rnf25 [Symbiodinium pilosum]|uniref:Rnf25 protein n=1 Tax=Symbiodinium pilosum TaxID=2952 RepID=A0A812XIG2_SYMPI|nr:Rnf25 [Symbiodinium pilosum]
MRISVELVPHTAGEDQERFVRCQLLLDVPQSYPQRPVRPALGTSRGLTESRSRDFISKLSAEAVLLLGQPALYALLQARGWFVPVVADYGSLGRGPIDSMTIQAAQDMLTVLNSPSGDCAICLLELDADDAEADPVVRTPCYHAFHRGCLASYWWTEWDKQLRPLSLRSQYNCHVSTAQVSCPECRTRLPWPELGALHSFLEGRDAERKEALALVHQEREQEKQEEPEQLEVLLPREAEMPRLQVPTAEKSEALLFEVVHPKGTCFRSRPRWSAKVANGQVARGVHGVVAELVEGDTTYLRPEGSKHFLPVKGLSANVKLIHLEPQSKARVIS